MMQDLATTTIAQYHVQKRLARGGMSEVYLAHDTEKEQTVAIKFVNSTAGDYCERFRHEVKTLVTLQHEHILPALDHGEHDSWCYLVTPYIEYGTLTARLAQGPLTFTEANDILKQLCSALQFAHERGIVHRDIKPSNVLLAEGKHVYLADFGLVKRVGEDNGLTVTGYLIGTPEYMAPELADDEATPLSDIYALGILLYQMLTRRVPFKGNTPMGIYLKHISEAPPPPSQFNPAIPPSIEQVIMRALEKKPQQRFQSAQELATAYEQAVMENKTPALLPAETSIKPVTQPIGMIGTQLPPFKVAVRQLGPRRPARTAAAAVAVFALPMLLGMSFYVFGSPVPQPAMALPGAAGNLPAQHTVVPTTPPSTPGGTTPTVTSGTSVSQPPSLQINPDPKKQPNDNKGKGSDDGHGHDKKKAN